VWAAHISLSAICITADIQIATGREKCQDALQHFEQGVREAYVLMDG
jgi:hypothetical protein